jgi:hypothetical protein
MTMVNCELNLKYPKKKRLKIAFNKAEWTRLLKIEVTVYM